MRRYFLAAGLSGITLAFLPSIGAAEAKGVKVTTDKTIDTSSLESIVKQVIERSGANSNDEKAIAIYEYLHNTIFHWAYPTENAPQSVGPLKVINAYGWGLCGGQHTVLKALYETAGWECRYVGWDGHTTVEVKYDGKWHYFDVFLKAYYWSKDKSHVVSEDEIAADPSIVLDAVKEGRAARQNLCCGDTPQDLLAGIKTRKIAGDSKGWASVTWRDQNYSPLVNLPVGASLRIDWKADDNGFAVNGTAPQHSCGTKDVRNDKVLGPIAEHYGTRSWSNGRFVYAPDFSRPSTVADVELKNAQAQGAKLVAKGKGGGVAIFKLPSPYPYVTAKVEADFEAGDGKVSISIDGGASWKAAAPGDVSPLVKQKYDVWFKVEFPGRLARFGVNAIVEHNRGAAPYLVNGKNKVTVSLDKGELRKGTVLVVTYVYQEATVANPENRKLFDGKGIIYGSLKTVTKETASVPYTFDIDVGGNTAPKMMSLERTLQAP
jgi:hypothetical protein